MERSAVQRRMVYLLIRSNKNRGRSEECGYYEDQTQSSERAVRIVHDFSKSIYLWDYVLIITAWGTATMHLYGSFQIKDVYVGEFSKMNTRIWFPHPCYPLFLHSSIFSVRPPYDFSFFSTVNLREDKQFMQIKLSKCTLNWFHQLNFFLEARMSNHQWYLVLYSHWLAILFIRLQHTL